MNEVALPALEGTNPLGFLAALGVLDALTCENPDATLRWTDELVPHAVVSGVSDLDLLLDVMDRDREVWRDSALLGFPENSPLPDAKPGVMLLREWFEAVAEQHDRRADSDLLCALVAEGALDGNGKAKPTHLHFTAGQQQFLEMVRLLAANVDRERLREAVCGPWRYDSPLPSLSWDARGERVYAVRAINPSKEKRLGVPGSDWLAFRGLVFYPVTRAVNGLPADNGMRPGMETQCLPVAGLVSSVHPQRRRLARRRRDLGIAITPDPSAARRPGRARHPLST